MQIEKNAKDALSTSEEALRTAQEALMKPTQVADEIEKIRREYVIFLLQRFIHYKDLYSTSTGLLLKGATDPCRPAWLKKQFKLDTILFYHDLPVATID